MAGGNASEGALAVDLQGHPRMPQGVQVLLHGVKHEVAALGSFLWNLDAARPPCVPVYQGKHRHQDGLILRGLPLLGTSRVERVVHLDHRLQSFIPGVWLTAVHPAPARSLHAFRAPGLERKVREPVALLVLFRGLYRHALSDRLRVRRRRPALKVPARFLRELSPFLFGGCLCPGEVRDGLGLRVVRVVLFFPNRRHPGALARSGRTGVGHEELTPATDEVGSGAVFPLDVGAGRVENNAGPSIHGAVH